VFATRISSRARRGDRSDPTASALGPGATARRAFSRRWASIADETRRELRSRASSPRRRAVRLFSVRDNVFDTFPSLSWDTRKEEG